MVVYLFFKGTLFSLKMMHFASLLIYLLREAEEDIYRLFFSTPAGPTSSRANCQQSIMVPTILPESAACYYRKICPNENSCICKK